MREKQYDKFRPTLPVHLPRANALVGPTTTTTTHVELKIEKNPLNERKPNYRTATKIFSAY